MGNVYNMAGGGGGIKLASIAIITPPDKTQYRPGQTFEPAGMTVLATYTNGATAVATGWAYSPSGVLEKETNSVTVLYTEGGITAKTQQAITVQKATFAVPIQNIPLVYTGGQQSPQWDGYDSAEMNISGTFAATDAGTYQAIFSLKDKVGSEWTDGSTGAKTAFWSIQKVEDKLSISPTSMTLDTNTTSKVITVTRDGTGAIKAQSSAPGVVSTSVNGNRVTVTGLSNGSAIITISAEADTNHTAPAPQTCVVQVSLVPANFVDASWDEIIAACQSGNVPSTWDVGSYKDMNIGGVNYRIDIIGKNHDTYANGGIAPLTFQMHDCFINSYQMNTDQTNIGGWDECFVRNQAMLHIKENLPPEIQNAIQEVQKKTSVGGQSSNIQTTTDKLFILSEVEIFGSTEFSFAGEGTQYAYYQAGNSKVKYLNGNAVSVWERSPNNRDSTRFCMVTTSGSALATYANVSNGIATAFCF